MTDHTVTLTQAERARVSTNQRPKDAATMLIIDRTSARPKVLMGKRHESHKFMPGKYVFPGGRLDDGDRQMHLGPAQSCFVPASTGRVTLHGQGTAYIATTGLVG